ncbi:MAG: transcription elongation factor subunit Spt4 [Acidilobus sp.]
MPVKAPARRISMKACKSCGAIVPRDVNVCPVCGGTTFVDDWEGIMIILSNSELAKRLKLNYKGAFAIKVAGTYVAK